MNIRDLRREVPVDSLFPWGMRCNSPFFGDRSGKTPPSASSASPRPCNTLPNSPSPRNRPLRPPLVSVAGISFVSLWLCVRRVFFPQVVEKVAGLEFRISYPRHPPVQCDALIRGRLEILRTDPSREIAPVSGQGDLTREIYRAGPGPAA